MRAALPLVVLALALPLAPAAPAPPPLPDMAWLEGAYADLAARYPGTFRDVGLRGIPSPHVAVLFHGPVPEDLGSLHAALPTVGYDVSGAEPLTHGAVVPTMLLLAQQVPPGIRPGTWMKSPAACSMAHVVRDQLDRAYILTAGHCAGAGQQVSLVAEGDIGVVVASRNGGVGADYALVRVDPQHEAKVSGSMVGWHGPVGLATQVEEGLVHHYGWGATTWQAHATRCRAGATIGAFWGVASFGFVGHVIWGDSGSGTNTMSGKALGINTHLGGIPDTALGTRTSFALAQLSSSLGLQLRVQDGPAQLTVCDVLNG